MGSPISLFLLTNQPRVNDHQPGRVDGYAHMVRTGEIDRMGHESFVPPEGIGADEWQLSVISALEEFDPTHVCIWNPSRMPANPNVAAQLRRALIKRLVIFWEGDPWGPGKTRSEAMKWWIGRADVIFSVSGPPQSEGMKLLGGSNIYPTMHTYDHLLFDENVTPPEPPEQPSAVFIGSNTARYLPLPGVAGMPGTLGRWDLVLRLHRSLDRRFMLYGAGWRFPWALGPLPFPEQVKTIRGSTVLANWDHYPKHADYASDRLAIGMLAGRPQVTTAHPGMTWLPKDLGVIEESSPRRVAARVASIVNGEDQQVLDQTFAGYEWARGRLSDREAARHIMSTVEPSIRRPPAEPWDQLPPLQ